MHIKIDFTPQFIEQLDRVIKDSVVKAIKEIKEGDDELVYWDRQELLKRTCMSWTFIQEQFFFDPRFQKHKVGSKWYFPATETRKFLELWLSEQRER